MLTPLQTLAMILAVAAGAALTRLVPFWLFPQTKKVPSVVLFLGDMLPPAMMGLLLVYCLKNADFAGKTHALPEGLALLVISLLHRWKHNALVSIAGGTAVYVVLLRLLTQAL